MKKRSVLTVLVLLLAAVSFAHAENLYWVSFSKAILSPFGNYSYVMQIDSLGNIKIPPKQIHTINYNSFELTTLANNGSRSMHVWVDFLGRAVRHGSVNKSTLAATGFAKIPLQPFTFGYQAVSSGAFLAGTRADTDGVFGQAYGMLSTGLPSGSSWGISPRTRTDTLLTTVSSDGRFALSTVGVKGQYQIYLQPLKTNGLPGGDPTVLDSSGFNISADISNPTAAGTRFAIFWNLTSGISITLQRVDALTGAKLGAQKSIATTFSPYFVYQDAVIDPDGRFILFGVYGSAGNETYFQALDAAGNASGSPRLLLSCGAKPCITYGLDILKN